LKLKPFNLLSKYSKNNLRGSLNFERVKLQRPISKRTKKREREGREKRRDPRW